MLLGTSILEGTILHTCQSVCMSVLRKVMGYGICNVAVSDGCCIDNRVSINGYLYNPSHYSMNDFQEFMRRDNDCVEPIPDFSLIDCVHYLKGDKGKYTICLVAPHCIQQWTRKDDPIDHAESETGTSRTLLLNHGLPGYQGLMDGRSGRKISRSSYTLFYQLYSRYNSPSRCDAQRLDDEYALAELASDMGFGTVLDVMDNVVPSVPKIIERLSAYLNLFNDSRVLLTLRPMVLTYWL